MEPLLNQRHDEQDNRIKELTACLDKSIKSKPNLEVELQHIKKELRKKITIILYYMARMFLELLRQKIL